MVVLFLPGSRGPPRPRKFPQTIPDKHPRGKTLPYGPGQVGILIVPAHPRERLEQIPTLQAQIASLRHRSHRAAACVPHVERSRQEGRRCDVLARRLRIAARCPSKTTRHRGRQQVLTHASTVSRPTRRPAPRTTGDRPPVPQRGSPTGRRCPRQCPKGRGSCAYATAGPRDWARRLLP